ncbi:MAG: TAXI family TRAP transporter solute-binding subunit [Proteobacteria bacterium]|nr:TAXI family TRAP transporter solute-binding subunit [Pseudomonadota bacterium]
MKSLKIMSMFLVFVFFFCSYCFAAPKTVIPIYTPGAGGTAYMVGAAMATVINKYVPEVQMMVEATGGTAAMSKLVEEKAEKNQPAFGVPDSKVTYMAYTGQAPFTKPLKSMRAITLTHLPGLNLVVPSNSPIKSYYDLKGKRIGVGAAGSGTSQMSVQLIEEHGISAKMFKPLWLGYNEVVEGIKDGSIDAGFISGTYPVPAIQQLAFEKQIRVIPVEEKLLKKILANNPYFGEYLLKSGAYKGITQDTPILVFGSFLFTHDKVDANLIYKITKVIFEHRDELLAICPGLKEMTLQDAQKTIAIPFHAGAVKYFKEMGVAR